ncbi:MAG: electron transfer flavoprotein subunit alpha/FixB family protein [Thermodesulfobacteriota bacterium]|nr:electron transfer flavoprotein subunit alpha/FixB family protein [Thermodesulfobacteriota bacterium]
MPVRTLLIADTLNNAVSAKSFELAGVADSLSPGRPDHAAYILAGDDITGAGQDLAEKTAISAIAFEGKMFRLPDPEALATAICAMPELATARYICFLHTPAGCHAAAKVAAHIDAACISGVANIGFDDDQPVLERSLLNGKVSMKTRPQTEQVVITTMPGAFATPEIADQHARPRVECRTVTVALADSRFHPETVSKAEETDTGLDRASIIVAAGRGIGDEENLALIHSLARTLPNAAVAASRPLCDLKWLSYAHQVGATGKTVSPKLYIACGISGAQQHLQGMQDSQCIVAVNTDPNAAIFSIADYCIVDDLVRFIPEIITAYEALNPDLS